MNTKKNGDIELDLHNLFMAMMHKLWLILIGAIVGTAIAVCITKFVITPKYSSSAMIYIMGQSADLKSFSISEIQAVSELTNDYMILVKSRPVLNQVIENLQMDMSYEELYASISTDNPTKTRILTITVNHPDAYMAKTIVDEVTNVAIKQTAKIMDTPEPSIVEQGTVNLNQISPNMKKNGFIGFLAGFGLVAFFVFIRFVMNDAIVTSEDVEKFLDMNTLGVIPIQEGLVKARRKNRSINQKRGDELHERNVR